MGKIAVPLPVERALARRAVTGERGRVTGRVLASGDGWKVEDVICTSGPDDRPFEEQHSWVSIAMVVAGTFQYRSTAGRDLMTPGSLLLGSAGQYFECGHEHGLGDRCIAFRYAPQYFPEIAAEPFRRARVPPLREVAPLVGRACAGLDGGELSWEEVALGLAGRVARLTGPAGDRNEPPVGGQALGRVSQVVRTIDRNPGARLTVASLARDAAMSPYHFLRTFARATGLTPHQYIVRARLRQAAARLLAEPAKVIEVALESGFGDVSNFNRTFRAEFGVSPRTYRASRQEPAGKPSRT